MDPITLIMTALTAGVTAGSQATVSEAIKDSYSGLKMLIKRKFAGKPEAELVLDKYEEKPTIWEAPFKDELMQFGTAEDEEIIRAAQRLLAQVDPQQSALGKYNVQIAGNAQPHRFVI